MGRDMADTTLFIIAPILWAANIAAVKGEVGVPM